MRAYRLGAEGVEGAPPPLSPQEAAANATRLESGSDTGKWFLRLAAYGAVTIGITLYAMRPSGKPVAAAGVTPAATTRAGGGSTSLDMGSGAIGLAFKTKSILSTDEANKSQPPEHPAVASTTSKPVVKANRPAKIVNKWPGAAVALAPPTSPGGAKVKPSVIQGEKNPFTREAKQQEMPAQSGNQPPEPDAPARPPQAVAAHIPAPSLAPPVQLGTRYQDNASGYSMQFPTGWTHRHVRGGGGWILDATDGRGAVISVGFAPFPANVTAEQVSPERIASALRSRPGTVVHGGGFGNVGGRKCLWHKYTGPITLSDGSARKTAVHYLLPLGDGRALELRAATAPERFNDMAPKMKQSVESFQLVSPAKPVRVASSHKKTA